MTIEAPPTPRPPSTMPEVEQPDSGGRIKTSYIVVGAVVALLLVVALFVGIIWAASNFAPELEAMRDIFIIALALESCLFGIILVIMLLMIVRLVNMLEFEIKPILEKTNETIGMVRGTTTFVGQNVVKPVAKATGYVAGVRKGLQVLFGDARRNLDE